MYRNLLFKFNCDIQVFFVLLKPEYNIVIMSMKSIVSNIWFKNFVAIIAVILLLSALLFYLLGIYTRHNQSIVVPDVKGMTEAEAAPLLKSKGFRYEIVDEVFIKGKTPGTICEQIPGGGMKVKPNRIIYLTINSFSSKQIELPDVRNISLREAETMLLNRGFAVSVEYVDSEFKDLVLKMKKGNTVVYPGAKLTEGTRLTLEVGSGTDSSESESESEAAPAESNTEQSFNDEAWF